MKLSEAIRLGAMMGPQVFKRAFDRGTLGSCAIGAAGLAIGGVDDVIALPERWPWFDDPTICPECGHSSRNLGRTLVCLNDTYRWTREQIADWVATIEPAEVEQAQNEPVLEASEV